MPRPREWQLQTAKARLSEVFGLARSEGPQRITRHAKEAVVVLAAEQYDQLISRGRSASDLVELLATSPLREVPLDLTRATDHGREVQL